MDTASYRVARGVFSLGGNSLATSKQIETRRAASLPCCGESTLANRGRCDRNHKSPEVMLISFVSASSSRLDPHRPALVASLRVATCDLTRAPGSPPTG